jgi:hypothetical protein
MRAVYDLLISGLRDSVQSLLVFWTGAVSANRFVAKVMNQS